MATELHEALVLCVHLEPAVRGHRRLFLRWVSGVSVQSEWDIENFHMFCNNGGCCNAADFAVASQHAALEGRTEAAWELGRIALAFSIIGGVTTIGAVVCILYFR